MFSVPDIEQDFDQRLGSHPQVKTFALERELSLAGRVELLFRAVPGGKMNFGRLHFRGRGQGPDQDLFRVGYLSLRRRFQAGGGAVGGGMLQFLAQHGRINSQLLRNFQRQLIANDPARHPLDVRKKIVDRLDLAFGAAHGKLSAGAFDQVVEIFLRSS